MVIEQKYVDFIIGPSGQSLAALNYAAGVTVHLDQSHSFAGYTIANIYGPEECAKRAKMALEFKISQWLPRGVSYSNASHSGVSAAAAAVASSGRSQTAAPPPPPAPSEPPVIETGGFL